MTCHSVALITIVVALGFSTTANAQALGELARQEAARRQTVAPGKVFTNGNLKPVPPSTATPSTVGTTLTPPPPSPDGDTPAAEGTASTPDAKPATAAPSDGRRTEAYWRDRLTGARDNLSRSQTFHDALQARIGALALDFVNRDDPAQRAQVERDHIKALAELERVKKDIAQSQKEITDIQDEGRRAGAPAGWLR